MNIYDCSNVTFSYPGAVSGRPLLDDLSLTVPAGITLGIIGPNGSGKSTLIKCLYKSLIPQKGTINFNGTDLNQIGTRQLSKLLSVVVQSESASLPLTVREYVELGRATYHNAFEGYSSQDAEIADSSIEMLGLRELADIPITRVSGGEHQRAKLARALCQSTSTMLLDEPTNHLDIYFQHQILKIVKKRNLSAIVVLHDLNLAAIYCELIAVLDKGKIVALGKPEDVLIPEILEDVYRVTVQRIDTKHGVQLLLLPMN